MTTCGLDDPTAGLGIGGCRLKAFGIQMNCSFCGTPTAPSSRFCPGCNADIGYPNVRLAQPPEEQTALYARLAAAETSASARGCLGVLNDFGVAVSGSKAVIARTIGVVDNLLKSDNQLYINYHKQVRSGARLPEENAWDQGRVAAESTILPNIHEEISFAALSLDGVGVAGYGPYSIVLKEAMIEKRATVFEENPFQFCQRHRVVAGNPAPYGYRAAWGERNQLAKAKLQAKLNATTQPDEYSKVLIGLGHGTGDADFIEVHIFGPIHRHAVERVIGPRPKRGPDLVIWKSIDRILTSLGATLETA
jgi:hypothetical protein